MIDWDKIKSYQREYICDMHDALRMYNHQDICMTTDYYDRMIVSPGRLGSGRKATIKYYTEVAGEGVTPTPNQVLLLCP